MRNHLEGKVVWITGGGSGIGLAAAVALVSAGAHVVISGRNPATNASALAQLQALGSAQAVLLNVSDKQAVKAAAADLLAPPAGTTPGSTTLTGAQGVAVDTSLLGRNSLLGG